MASGTAIFSSTPLSRAIFATVAASSLLDISTPSQSIALAMVSPFAMPSTYSAAAPLPMLSELSYSRSQALRSMRASASVGIKISATTSAAGLVAFPPRPRW